MSSDYPASIFVESGTLSLQQQICLSHDIIVFLQAEKRGLGSASRLKWNWIGMTLSVSASKAVTNRLRRLVITFAIE